MSDSPPILRPQPRRLFTMSPPDSEPTSPAENSPTSASSPSFPNGPRTPDDRPGFGSSRTRSVLNLTASTLAGIYAPDDDSSLFGVTPLPTGGHTTPRIPAGFSEEDRERDRMAPVIGALEQPQFRRTPTAVYSAPTTPAYIRIFRGLVRAALLFGLGATYGSFVTHLHDTRELVPVKIEGVRRHSIEYTIFWGLVGILLGTALPIVDAIWEGEGPDEKRSRQQALAARGKSPEPASRPRQGTSPLAEAVGLGAEWHPAVRSIGAFVGIGFAIRRLPWQSTLQASVTLGMVNPCLWYMIDRTVPGFALASTVGILGTGALLGTNIVPMPDVKGTAAGQQQHAGAGVGTDGAGLPLGIEQGTLAVWVWIASVLFCSCVCFGNIGRRLAV